MRPLSDWFVHESLAARAVTTLWSEAGMIRGPHTDLGAYFAARDVIDATGVPAPVVLRTLPAAIDRLVKDSGHRG